MSQPKTTPKSLGHVLVIGGCGFLGHHIVKMILERHPSSRIAVLDLHTTKNRIGSPNISYQDGDITNEEFLVDYFKKSKFNVVIHTASPLFNGNKKLLDKVNVGGTKNVVKACKESGVTVLVYTSSAMVTFDVRTGAKYIDERWPYVVGKEQIDYYAHTKAHAESAVLEANRKPANMLTCAIRPAGIFGEGDVQNIPKIISAYNRGQHKFQIGTNDNLYDFTYVENVAHCHLLAVNALISTSKLDTAPIDTERVDGEAFFCTNDEPIYFWDFARAVWKECGDPLPLNKVWKLNENWMGIIGFWLENIMWIIGKTPNLTSKQVIFSTFTRYFNIDKAKQRLGYEPIVGLEDAIKRSVKHQLELESQEKSSIEKKGQ